MSSPSPALTDNFTAFGSPALPRLSASYSFAMSYAPPSCPPLPVMTSWPPSLLLLLFITIPSFLHSSSLVFSQAANFSIPFTTWGPLPINNTGVEWVNATVYNGTLPPVNYSLPTLRLAGVITQTGAYTANTALFNQILPFMLDVINMKGGVQLNNQSYLLSLTWVDDGSSSQYLQLLYSQWINDPTIAVLLSPPTNEQYQILLSLMQATNRTWLNLADTGTQIAPFSTGRRRLSLSCPSASLTSSSSSMTLCTQTR